MATVMTAAFDTREGCPACAGETATIYRSAMDAPPISNFLESFYGRPVKLLGEYRIEECVDCRTLFQAEVGNSEFLEWLYEELIPSDQPEDDEGYAFDVTHPALSRDGHEIMAAASFLDVPLKELRTLDYGMGWASWARISNSLGCQSHGYDLSKNRNDYARSHGVSSELGDLKFHFINTEQLMEHVPNPSALVKELAERLLPGGILKISVPSNHGILATLSRLRGGQQTLTHDEIMPLHPLEHVNCFTIDGIGRLGARHGLRMVRPSYWHRYAFLPGISLRYPRNAAKELVRPFYQWRNPRNLYAWLTN